MAEFKQYRRSQIAEMADWEPGFDMSRVSVSDADRDAGSPKRGDKIARNPKNHDDRWLVAADYFADNFEPMENSSMSLPNLSGVGRLTQDPNLRFAPSGVAVCDLNLAFNSRKQDASGNWVDGDVFYIRATAFKTLAEHAGECLQKGMEVVVSGQLKTEQWNDKQTGDKRSAPSLILDSIGPNLAFATASVTKAVRGSDAPRSSGPVDDPWSSSPADSAAPF